VVRIDRMAGRLMVAATRLVTLIPAGIAVVSISRGSIIIIMRRVPRGDRQVVT
jgi:hypothetical protein